MLVGCSVGGIDTGAALDTSEELKREEPAAELLNRADEDNGLLLNWPLLKTDEANPELLNSAEEENRPLLNWPLLNREEAIPELLNRAEDLCPLLNIELKAMELLPPPVDDITAELLMLRDALNSPLLKRLDAAPPLLDLTPLEINELNTVELLVGPKLDEKNIDPLPLTTTLVRKTPDELNTPE